MGKIRMWIQRFMMGRYGTDKLNMTILVTGVALCVVSLFFVRIPMVSTLLTTLSYILMIWANRCPLISFTLLWQTAAIPKPLR